MSKRVSFLLVGVQKSGTTTLHSYLNDHPQILMARKKEVHFFNSEQFFLNAKNAEPDYEYYHSWFDNTHNNDNRLRGEATPAYLYCRDAAVRIWQYNPAMKIIIILRNPIERAFSHWNMEVNRGAETLSFKNALINESQRCQEALPLQHYVYSYLDRGFYSSQIREYLRCFGKEQVLVLKYDDLQDKPVALLKELFTFLELEITDKMKAEYGSHKKILHQAKYTASIDKYSYQFMLKRYKHEILLLESMLNWDCSSWFK